MTTTTKTPPAALNGEADAFDLDAWITSAKLPEKSATVYGRGDLEAELTDLETQLEKAANEPNDDRMGAPSAVAAVSAQIKALRAEMTASALTFRFRGLSRATQNQVRAGAALPGESDPSDEALALAWVTAAAVRPVLGSIEVTQRLRDKIGEQQFINLWSAAYGASTAQVSVPLSLVDSEMPLTQG